MPFLLGLWSFAKLIPWWIYAAAAITVAAFAWLQVHDHKLIAANDEKWQAKIHAEQEVHKKQLAVLQAKQAAVVTKTVTEYRDRIKIVKEQGNVIIREVEKLVPSDTCTLHGGMRVAHDAAASGVMPDDPERAARTAASVEAAALARTVAENYSACRAEFAKLVSLQTLVHNLEGLKP